ncbi:hypothetical protein [Hyphomicrobium sp.]|uniref:hypothetical protein n=1 Tax=Hyphomicrobium sp. TaxID=82 RepID=UPI000F914637|nr:hypothetical protein [Hyphomicrobium sp.]RUO98149.1 MAG: hypothetical protein EKK30_15670 [Hyphomicrobium sp.]
MFAIYLSACLLRDPSVCREFKIDSGDDSSSMACLMQAPLQFGFWAKEHPGWQIARWRCGASSENKI